MDIIEKINNILNEKVGDKEIYILKKIEKTGVAKYDEWKKIEDIWDEYVGTGIPDDGDSNIEDNKYNAKLALANIKTAKPAKR